MEFGGEAAAAPEIRYRGRPSADELIPITGELGSMGEYSSPISIPVDSGAPGHLCL